MTRGNFVQAEEIVRDIVARWSSGPIAKEEFSWFALVDLLFYRQRCFD
jgi:hypothetical protein